MIKVQELLQEEVTRKDFIRYIGVAMLGVMGVTSFIQSLSHSFSKQSSTTHKEIGGYGGSPYGR